MRLGAAHRQETAAAAVSRRRLLAGFAGLAAAPLLPAVSAVGDVPRLATWPTGNERLAPVTFDGKVLYVAGNRYADAWDPEQGAPLWRRELDAPAVFRPRLGAGFVLTAGRETMTAWNVSDGSRRWSLAAGPEQELAVPLVHDGRVHVGERHQLKTVDAATGDLIWTFDTDPRARIAYAATAYKDTILLGPGDGKLYALSAADGKLVWTLDRERDWQYLRQLHMHGNILVAGGYHDEVFGIDADDGTPLWRFDAGNFVNSHLVSDGKVYFWSPTGWIYALDAVTGRRVWRHKTTDFRKNVKSNWAPIMAELVADDRHLYVLAMDQVLHVLDKATGDKTAEHRLPVTVRPFVCLTGRPGRFVFGSTDGDIVRLDIG